MPDLQLLCESWKHSSEDTVDVVAVYKMARALMLMAMLDAEKTEVDALKHLDYGDNYGSKPPPSNFLSQSFKRIID
ncbi:hypothetical protein EVAR_39154_1 [Eumeta japonica]|uniref:Uncharacterized protein n=1 Tax=Eumeta variegata TaxID=151549 RepID=A0A4C1X5N0_EUMVA|nr:hypothetical protein EVAR_39154_1 [Eumeta japonica]